MSQEYLEIVFNNKTIEVNTLKWEVNIMNLKDTYNLPRVWIWQQKNDGAFSNINRPISGPTFQKSLPKGQHPFQLYSQGTPNGIKITIMLEELLEIGHKEAEYDAWFVDIELGEQFSSGFCSINPNSKIPTLVDHSSEFPIPVFESGAILLYLAEKFFSFIPDNPHEKSQCLSWLFWQVASTPYLGGGFGHFYHYAPIKLEYPINRFTMEVKRQMDVLDKHLEKSPYLSGNTLTIADIAIWPWYGALVEDDLYNASEFLQAKDYTNLKRWSKTIKNRPAVRRGCIVNQSVKEENNALKERHSSKDFDGISFDTG